jgi:secreted trypsin-like serine protease
MRAEIAVTIVLTVLAAGCGGSGTSSATISPSPTPTTPVSAACDALGQTGSARIQIVNGAACSATNTPVALLNMKDADGQQVGSCSGTVIAPRAILTAAHCLASTTASIKVFLGTGPEIVAQSFARHPNYRETDNTTLDVGVVLLSDDVGRPAVPLLLSRDARVGETAVIAGWGKDQTQTLATLRAGVATITVVSTLTLQTQFTTDFSSTCQGDSGGPLLLSEGGVWAIAGIISANSTLACSFGANFYANVRDPDISSFILSRVANATRR